MVSAPSLLPWSHGDCSRGPQAGEGQGYLGLSAQEACNQSPDQKRSPLQVASNRLVTASYGWGVVKRYTLGPLSDYSATGQEHFATEKVVTRSSLLPPPETPTNIVFTAQHPRPIRAGPRVCWKP